MSRTNKYQRFVFLSNKNTQSLQDTVLSSFESFTQDCCLEMGKRKRYRLVYRWRVLYEIQN